MFVTYVRGGGKRRQGWGGEQLIAHFTTRDPLTMKWTFSDIAPLTKVNHLSLSLPTLYTTPLFYTYTATRYMYSHSPTYSIFTSLHMCYSYFFRFFLNLDIITSIFQYAKVLDPEVEMLPGGNYKMWFKDIRAKGQTGAAVSSDLVNWHRLTNLEVMY